MASRWWWRSRAASGWAASAARRPGSAGDAAVTVLSMLFYAVPQFWLGMMMVLVFAVWLGWLPPFGIETMGADYTGLAPHAAMWRGT